MSEHKLKDLNLSKGYMVIEKVHHSDSQLIKAIGSDHEFIMTENITNTEKSAKKMISDLETQTKESKNLQYNQKLVDYEVKKDSGLCSTTWVIRAFYEPVEKDLRDLHKSNRSYELSQETLTNGLYGGLHGIDEWNQKKLNYSDVRPENIGFSFNMTGLLRIKN